jgi:hypothetical protein
MGKSKNEGKSNNTDRNSTDTNNYEAETSINFMPTLKKKDVITDVIPIRKQKCEKQRLYTL